MIGRPKIKDKKKNLSLSLNIELVKILDKYLEDKNINKSKYVEYLIKKDMNKSNKEFNI